MKYRENNISTINQMWQPFNVNLFHLFHVLKKRFLAFWYQFIAFQPSNKESFLFVTHEETIHYNMCQGSSNITLEEGCVQKYRNLWRLKEKPQLERDEFSDSSYGLKWTKDIVTIEKDRRKDLQSSFHELDIVSP